MEFIETSFFTRRLLALMTDEDYGMLQNLLRKNPERGDIITGGGGIRKIRWRIVGRGKRGGARIIYYWETHRDIILMLAVYSKAEKQDVTAEQLRVMRRVVEAEFYG